MATESGDLRPTATIFDGVWHVFTDLRITLGLLLAGAGLLVLLILAPTVMGGVGGPVLRVISALLAFSLALRLALHIERAAHLCAGRYMAPDFHPARRESGIGGGLAGRGSNARRGGAQRGV